MFKKLMSQIRYFFNKEEKRKIEFLRLSAHKPRLQKQTKERKNFKIRIDLHGKVLAHCESCDCFVDAKESKGFIWFVCSMCYQINFYPVGNIQRHKQPTEQGNSLEYGTHYIEKLPTDLQPPA